MKKSRFNLVFLVVVLLLDVLAFTYGEDQVVTLNDGKQAVLHDGFTWEYYSAPAATIDTPSIHDTQIPRDINGQGAVTFRGAEMGNAFATTFGASSGQVGKNIYVPIYLYMPLPTKVDDSIYRNIADKVTFRSHYRQSWITWLLKAQAPLPLRVAFWTMLETAGYDASMADFKTAMKLAPVVLEFTVGSEINGRAELVDLRLASSSGSREVDEAVIYGLRQASFFNKTGKAVAGKFVYSF